MYSCWFSSSNICDDKLRKNGSFLLCFFIAMVYENYKFFDTYVCGSILVYIMLLDR